MTWRLVRERSGLLQRNASDSVGTAPATIFSFSVCVPKDEIRRNGKPVSDNVSASRVLHASSIPLPFLAAEPRVWQTTITTFSSDLATPALRR